MKSPPDRPRSQFAKNVREFSVTDLLVLCENLARDMAYFAFPDERSLLLRRANIYRALTRMLRDISLDAVASSRHTSTLSTKEATRLEKMRRR